MTVLDSSVVFQPAACEGLPAESVCSKRLDFGKRRARIRSVSEALEKIVDALEEGQATTEQQKEAARVIRDLDQELRELLEWDQRD